MISHDSIKELEVSEDDIIIIKMDDIPEYDIEDYDLMDPKDRNKYIKDLERIVRNSFEYREFIKYLRENMDMDKCAIMENVSNKETYKVGIEIHHGPFTLYDICVAVLNRRLELGLSTSIEMVAKEVAGLHYYLMVGLIPLSKTVHELVHNKYIFIPYSNYLGNYEGFIDNYGEYIAPELMETYESNLDYSNKLMENDLSILEKKYTYVDASNAYQLPSYQNAIDKMYERVNEIKQLNDPFKEEKKVIPGIIFE